MIKSDYPFFPIYSDLFGEYSTTDFEKNYNDIEERIFFSSKHIFLHAITKFSSTINETTFEYDKKKFDYFFLLDKINPRLLCIEIVQRHNNFSQKAIQPDTHRSMIEECIGRIQSIEFRYPKTLNKNFKELSDRICTNIRTGYKMLEKMFYQSFDDDDLISQINNLIQELLLQQNKHTDLSKNFWTGLTDISGKANKSKFWKYFFSRSSIEDIFTVLKLHQLKRFSPFDLYLRLANSTAKDLMLAEWSENKWHFSKAIKDIDDVEYGDDIKEVENVVFFRKEMPTTGYATAYLYKNDLFHIHVTYPKAFEDDFVNVLANTRIHIAEAISRFIINKQINIKRYSLNDLSDINFPKNNNTNLLEYYAQQIIKNKNHG